MSTASKASPEAESMSIKAILAPLVAIIIGLFMVILDGTAMNVALRSLMSEFGRDLSVVQWTVTGYALAQAAVIPLAGWLSDRYGAKRIFIISVGLFTIGSLLCALANTVEMLILFRILQGLGGGMVMPIAMAIIYRLSPPGKVGTVMGMLGVPILLAPALGPVVAGLFVDYASWEWIFLINIPIGIIGIFAGIRTLPNIERQAVAALDMLGIIFGPLAFAALSFGVSEGAVDWTSGKTIGGIAIGVVALIIFIIAELSRKQPLLELRVFRSPDFTKGIIVQWISQIALFGSMFLVPLFLQLTKGYTALETGLIMLPQAIASGLFMPIGGKLFDKFGVRPLLVTGMGIVTLASYLFSTVSAEDGLFMIMLPLALLGAGMGLSMMPLNTHLIQAAPQNLVGRVTSLTTAAQQVMTSFAVAGLSTILANRMEAHPEFDPMSMMQGLGVLFDSYSDTFFILSVIAFIGMLLGFLLKKPKQAPSDGSSPEVEAPIMAGH
ncbi:MDR family MFS transporter [Marinicrinis sediminis]|uniref:MDR family MFS transporter n=1 Tax=Marinicrinis sediminis TaxID=1652465 RepID=A0ABW5R7C3_9BACL